MTAPNSFGEETYSVYAKVHNFCSNLWSAKSGTGRGRFIRMKVLCILRWWRGDSLACPLQWTWIFYQETKLLLWLGTTTWRHVGVNVKFHAFLTWKEMEVNG